MLFETKVSLHLFLPQHLASKQIFNLICLATLR